jgi:hypothetical protein
MRNGRSIVIQSPRILLNPGETEATNAALGGTKAS